MSTGTATIIIGLLSLALPSVGGAVAWLTARYVKQRWLRELICSVAGYAVDRVEREIVQPLKDDPLVNTPGGKLTASQAIKAKAAALEIGQDVLSKVGKEAAPHILGAAIESAVARLKPKKAVLPQETKDLFPVAILGAFLAVSAFGGCSTLPQGWSTASAQNVQMAATLAATLYAGQVTGPRERDAACIVSCGIVAAATYNATANSDMPKEERLQMAAKAATRFAKKAYPDVVKNRSLVQVLSDVLALRVDLSEAEGVLSIIRAALSVQAASLK